MVAHCTCLPLDSTRLHPDRLIYCCLSFVDGIFQLSLLLEHSFKMTSNLFSGAPVPVDNS
jgi:hypothetical protein